MDYEVSTRQTTEQQGKAKAALRAIEAGNYGAKAQSVARSAQGAAFGRLRHLLYLEGCDKAGDALSLGATP